MDRTKKSSPRLVGGRSRRRFGALAAGAALFGTLAGGLTLASDASAATAPDRPSPSGPETKAGQDRTIVRNDSAYRAVLSFERSDEGWSHNPVPVPGAVLGPRTPAGTPEHTWQLADGYAWQNSGEMRYNLFDGAGQRVAVVRINVTGSWGDYPGSVHCKVDVGRDKAGCRVHVDRVDITSTPNRAG